MFITHMQQSITALHPTQTIIRLSADRLERQSTLMAMKDQKLNDAKRFISEWSRDLDTNLSFSQENQFESLDGGFSVIRFDNAPMHGTTVKAAFDAVVHSMQNVDILISELFGSITIREDTNFDASDIYQMRLVSTTTHGAVVESNSVIFSEYVESPSGSYAIIAGDFVDEDKLYPYRTNERVRRNTLTVVMIKSAKSSYGQDVVVGTRWTCLNLAHTQLDIPMNGLKELKEVSMAWGDTIKKAILERLAKSDQ
ncbi:hypothetical protein PHMEG_00024423 [Phytophthora megakarya]|uniref:Uncharacterized protein n=1 Tax=Phytophthora megakarya TaxID=4795 RepID=A0A225VFZ7_9STRA|nr:hypothetical protein PHMEG_00024423 [Phytophthora megakarya]